MAQYPPVVSLKCKRCYQYLCSTINSILKGIGCRGSSEGVNKELARPIVDVVATYYRVSVCNSHWVTQSYLQLLNMQ